MWIGVDFLHGCRQLSGQQFSGLDSRVVVNTQETDKKRQGFFALALSRPVAIRAIKVALIVGTILAIINQGDKIFAMSLTSQAVVQIILTYLVPYSVSTWSAVKAIEEGLAKAAQQSKSNM